MNELFEIFRVNKSVLKDLVKASKVPHQHHYEEIIVVINGTIEHFIDFDSTLLHAPFVSFITKGKPHQIRPIDNSEDCDGFVIRFQSEFVSEIIFQLYHFFHQDANIVFSSTREFERYVSLCEMLNDEAQQDFLDYSIVRSLLNTMLTILESEKKKSIDSYVKSNKNNQFVKFLELLEKNYHQPVGVTFYSEKLQMTSRNLNFICQRILQKSVTEIIQTRKLIQAKNLLTTSDKTISEIGFEIGYKEKSYFSNIFKKKTGKTPSQFRNEINALYT